MTKENQSDTPDASASENSDMNRLRDLLFGEQALQTDDRFAALDMAVNALRRENRSLRQALEIEAMARLEADRDEASAASSDLDQSMVNIAQILVDHLTNEKAARSTQAEQMAATLEAFQKSQDEVTSRLIDHLKQEQKARSAQFAQLRKAIAADAASHNDLTDALSNALNKLSKAHESRKTDQDQD